MPVEYPSSLMQMSPGVGGYFAGQKHASDLQTDALRRRELESLVNQRAAELQMKQQELPLNLENKRLVNQGLDAGLGSIRAKSTLDELKARAGQETYRSDVDAQISTNQGTVSKNNYDNFTRARDTMLQAGAMVQNVPAPMRGAAFTEMIKQSGINPNAKHIQNILQIAQTNPDMLPQAIQSMADALGKQAELMDPRSRVTKSEGALDRASREKVAAGNNAATIEAANIGARSRQAIANAKNGVGDLWSALRSGKTTPEKAFAGARAEMVKAKTEEERQLWKEFAADMERLIYNKAQAGKEGDPVLRDGGLDNKELKPVIPKGSSGKTSSGVGYKILPSQ